MKLLFALFVLAVPAIWAKSQCEKDRESAQGLGAYRPQCETDGSYHHTQCMGSVCFCVDTATGKQVKGTEGPISDKANVERRCGGELSECEKQQQTVNGMVGAYRPRCENDGKFHPTQCFGSVCFCVDLFTGEKHTGTETPIADFDKIEKRCTEEAINHVSSLVARSPSQCEKDRQSAQGLGAYRPQCETDGSYHHTQCMGSVCFCVDTATGKQVKGTEGPISDKANVERRCGGQLSECEKQNQDSKANAMVGAYRPRCENDGKFHPTQCFGSVCFCVDLFTGEKHTGTETPIADYDKIEKRCTEEAINHVSSLVARSPSKCEKERAGVGAGRMGAYRPRCEGDGKYHSVQCFGSVCFCVDPASGEKHTGTEDSIANYADLEKRCTAEAVNGLTSFVAKLPESQCEKERAKALQSHMMGVFVPNCDDNGNYHMVQCRESVCFCVDELSGTKRSGSGSHISEFDQLESRCKMSMSRCEEDRSKSAQKHLIGAYIPRCEPTGEYEKAQCHGSVCYCVDEISGRKIDGTEAHISKYSEMKEKCSKTDCLRQREKDAKIGGWKPKCDPDHGNFAPVQCKEAECFCVDHVTGKQSGDAKPIGKLGELHESCMTDCEKKRDLQTGELKFGRSRPRCEANGDYHNVQCTEAVCSCVDKDGQSLVATEKNIGKLKQLERQCPGGVTKCSDYRVAYRWSKCPEECTYYQGYGEALVYCCCD